MKLIITLPSARSQKIYSFKIGASEAELTEIINSVNPNFIEIEFIYSGRMVLIEVLAEGLDEFGFDKNFKDVAGAVEIGDRIRTASGAGEDGVIG